MTFTKKTSTNDEIMVGGSFLILILNNGISTLNFFFLVKQRETHVYKRRHINNAKVSSNTAKQNSTGFRAKSRKRRRKLKIKMEILIKRDESVTTLIFLSALISHDFFSKMKGARFFKKINNESKLGPFQFVIGLKPIKSSELFPKGEVVSYQ